jgi:3-deoxy-D-manno-octulosonate 8-phosphate phosphatase (KDO 8-P phosphatase)
MIKHLVMDVDGVLNTGHFIYDETGKRYKVFGPHDKDGLEIAKSLGLTIDFVTADESGLSITKARIIKDWKFKETQLHLVKDGSRLEWLRKLYNIDEVAFIGDGIHDAPVLSAVKLGIAPVSGRREAKAAAKYVTESPAGSGAVLDACIIIKNYIERDNLFYNWMYPI